MGLYEALTESGASWDDLDAAIVQEYRFLGKPIRDMLDFRQPDGSLLFPDAVSEGKRDAYPRDALLLITREDVLEELQERLGRELREDEFAAVLSRFKKALDCLDWTSYLDEAIQTYQDAGQIGQRVENVDLGEDHPDHTPGTKNG